MLHNPSPFSCNTISHNNKKPIKPDPLFSDTRIVINWLHRNLCTNANSSSTHIVNPDKQSYLPEMELERTSCHREDGRPRKSLTMKSGQRGSRWGLRHDGSALKTEDKLLGELELSRTRFNTRRTSETCSCVLSVPRQKICRSAEITSF